MGFQHAIGEEVDSKMDLTDRIETLPAIEQKLGLKLEALYAEFVQGDFETGLRINYDVTGSPGETGYTQITIGAYNDAGQLVGTENYLLSNESFVGIESVSEFIETSVVPARIRVYPKPV